MSALIEISRNEWCQLRDLYVEQKKVSTGYNMLQNFINWIEQNPEEDIQIYALDGDWQNDGTFVLSARNNVRQVYFNTLSSNIERVTKALSLLDASEYTLFYGYPERFVPAVKQFWLNKGYKEEDVFLSGGVWFHISKEIIDKFDISAPDGINLLRLQLKHAEQINSVWPHRGPDSIKFVAQMIQYNVSVGAFDQHDNLIAWCLQLPLGSLGLLQVSESHKRKGFGSLMVRYISKLIADQNMEVLAPVVFQNAASRGMFEKLGACIIDNVYWSGKNTTEN